MQENTIVKIETKALLKGLKFITPVVPDKKKDEDIVCEITVTDGQLRLNTVGASGSPIPCKTIGMGKATISLKIFTKIARTFKQQVSELEIMPQRLRMNSFSMAAQTTFIENDTILRSITLPVNYSDFHLLRLPYQNYTPEEIAFNKFQEKIEAAQEKLDKLIQRTSYYFKQYGVEEAELQKLLRTMVLKKLKGQE